MITQRNKLLELLPRFGWAITNTEDQSKDWKDSEWFVDELWEVESVWSPKGFKVWITFVVDPQAPNLIARKKGQGVWAVKAARRKPTSWNIEPDELGLVLNKGWEDRLLAFFDQLAVLRQQ